MLYIYKLNSKKVTRNKKRGSISILIKICSDRNGQVRVIEEIRRDNKIIIKRSLRNMLIYIYIYNFSILNSVTELVSSRIEL